MKPAEITENPGVRVRLNGSGDLAFHFELKPFILDSNRWLEIIKLTKGGKALLRGDDGREYSVPPRNVDIWDGKEGVKA